MISYIFKSRAKNILFTCSVAIMLFLTLTKLYDTVIWVGICSNEMLKNIFSFVSYLSILIYMLILKREFKFKNWLFPIAFMSFALRTVFSLLVSLKIFPTTLISDIVYSFLIIALNSIVIWAYIFCFIGSLSNFKKITFFRIGILFFVTALIVWDITHTAQTISYLIKKTFSFVDYLSMISENRYTLSFFYISLLVLAFTKKSDNIDITPFVKARQAKRALKKQQKDTVEVYIPPVVPDNCWRCMGCDNILPDDIDQCECGYKRQQ